jgi:hypothetical protein
MRRVADSVLLGSWFFAKELFNLSAFLLDVGNSSMLRIGNTI